MKKKIDYNQPITRDHVDMVAYNAKFKFVDKVKQLKHPHPKYMFKILNDPTLFAYYYFTLNSVPLTLHTYQDFILNDPHRFKIFRAARQIGKSLALDIKAAVNLCKDHGHHHNECIISLSLDQAKFQMRRVKAMLNSAKFDWRPNKGDTDNVSIITVDWKDERDTSYVKEDRPQRVKYSNMLVVAPCTGAALGYDFHAVNLDEIEYWPDIDIRYFFNNIIEPTILTTKGTITTFSNPNGMESFIAELEQLTLPSGDKKYHTYVFDFMDYPGRVQEDFDIATVGKTRQEIESQYLAIRTLSDKYYFSTDEIEQSYSEKLEREKGWYLDGKESYWFLDVGAKRDQSVLVGCTARKDDEHKDVNGTPYTHIDIVKFHVYPVGYPISRVVGSFDESQATDGWHHEKSVKEYLEEHQLAKGVNPVFGCDVTGNSGISPLFKSVGVTPVDITFSGQKKWALAQRCKYFLEKKLLHRVKCKEFDYQMKRIIVTRLRTMTYNRVGHELETDLDDVFDATIGAIFIADNPVAVELSVRFF